jgi:glycosyltransferase involved in cell wall biosynthesis
MNLLIISHDVIGSRMAGPGIRYWELARVLAHRHAVTLIAPQPIDAPPPAVRCGDFAIGAADALRPWLAQADAVLANGAIVQFHPEIAAGPPLLLDLYDPTALEHLELFRHEPPERRAEQHTSDVALLQTQLRIGSAFICATERQRDLYMGALMAAGRLTPTLAYADPTLRSLIDVVPFGLPETQARHEAAALRGVVPGIDEGDLLLLWTGGLWDWMDPQTLIAAMPAVVAALPQTRLVFLAGRHPGNVAPMRTPDAARVLAAESGLLDRHIFFYDEWVLYARRADFLLESDLLVSLHRPGPESAYAAVRSRFLDHLWAGRASLVSSGDAAAALVERHELGRTVAPGDVAACAEQLIALLSDDALRASCAENARRLAADWSWERVAQPIFVFCEGAANQAGVRSQESGFSRGGDHTDTPLGPGDRNEIEMAIYQRNDEQAALVAELEQHWRIAEPVGGGLSALLRVLLLRLLAPVFAEQRAFNAALVKLAYANVERERHRALELESLVAQIALVHERCNTLGMYDGELNDRLTRLLHTVQQLNEGLANVDEAQASFAEQLAALKVRLAAEESAHA